MDGSAEESLDLATLLERSAGGDQASFAAFYDATAARAYGVALRVVRNPALAEEIAQDAYLEVWRTAGRFDPGRGSAWSWLMTIVHRRAVDRVRASHAAVRRDTAYGVRHRQVDHDATAETAHARLEAQRVRAALATLSDAQREAITLAYFGGLSHAEVATIQRAPVGTAKTRIRDGLIRLRRTLEAPSATTA